MSRQSPLSHLQQASPAKIKTLFVTAGPTYFALSASTGFTEAALRAQRITDKPEVRIARKVTFSVTCPFGASRRVELTDNPVSKALGQVALFDDWDYYWYGPPPVPLGV